MAKRVDRSPSKAFTKHRDEAAKSAEKFMNDCCPQCAFENYRGQQCAHFMDFHYWLKTFTDPDEHGYPRRMVCHFFTSKHFKSMINRHTPIPYLIDKPHEAPKVIPYVAPDSNTPDDGHNRPCGSPDDAA